MGKLDTTSNFLDLGLIQRFWRFVRRGKQHECWLWTGNCHKHGYGVITASGRTYPRAYLAHRVSYAIANGGFLPDPDQNILHLCDTPPCVNPRHLRLGTHLDNMLDAHQKGRLGRHPNSKAALAAIHATRRAQEYCKHGHLLSGSNLAVYQLPSGRLMRQCRSCNVRRSREYKHNGQHS